MRKLFIEVVYMHSIYDMAFWGVLAITIWAFLSHFALKTEQGNRVWVMINRFLFIIIVVFILSQTTLVRPQRARSVCLIPFFSFTFRAGSFRYNTVVANILLFIPFGLSLPFVLKRSPVGSTILYAAAFSILIELAQFLFKLGLCETDDVIFNTLGATLGTIAFLTSRSSCPQP